MVLSKVVVTLQDPFEKAWTLLKYQTSLYSDWGDIGPFPRNPLREKGFFHWEDPIEPRKENTRGPYSINVVNPDLPTINIMDEKGKQAGNVSLMGDQKEQYFDASNKEPIMLQHPATESPSKTLPSDEGFDAYIPDSHIEPEHRGQGLYQKTLLSMLSSPDLWEFSEGLASAGRMRSAYSDRSHSLFAPKYQDIMRTLMHHPTGEPFYSQADLTDSSLRDYFYAPIPVDAGKTGKEMESFGDLRRFDLGGLPIRIYDNQSSFKDWLNQFKGTEKPQTRFDLEIPTSQMYASQINELRDMPVWSADPQRMGTYVMNNFFNPDYWE